MEVLLLKDGDLQDQFATAVEWGGAPLCEVKEIARAATKGTPAVS